jgi:hypothetical protein
MSTICVKLDLGTHIGMHLVCFSKTRCDIQSAIPTSLPSVATLSSTAMAVRAPSRCRGCREATWGGATSATAWGKATSPAAWGRRRPRRHGDRAASGHLPLGGHGPEGGGRWRWGHRSGRRLARQWHEARWANRATGTARHYRKAIGPGLGWCCGPMVRHGPTRKRLRATLVPAKSC